jgi:uncharacterized protein YndB with AHSA1/START domain
MLIVRQSITIDAPADRVWTVLTNRNQGWVREFFPQGGELVSEWTLGSAVEWRTLVDQKTVVSGNVTAVEPHCLLRFTVFDVSMPKPPISDEDGIAFILTPHDGQTELTVTQGDFSKMDDGEKYYRATVDIWERALPQIKRLAEQL